MPTVMSSRPAAVFTILMRAARRLKRYWPSVVAGLALAMMAHLLLQNTAGEPRSQIEASIRLATSGVLWLAYVSFTLAVLSRGTNGLAVLRRLHRDMARTACIGGFLAWHTWIAAAAVGTLTLFINESGFQATVLTLWGVAIIRLIVRGPRLVLASVFMLQSHLTPEHAIEHSAQATRLRWGTITLTLLTAGGLMVIALRLAQLSGLTEMGLAWGLVRILISLVGQAYLLATLVELKESLWPRP